MGENLKMQKTWTAYHARARDAVQMATRKVPAWPLYIVGLLPIPVVFWMGLRGQLGVDPVKAMEHRYGLFALQFLMASLAVTPIRRLTGISLIRYRRALGLIAFAYVVAHLAVWMALDVRLDWAAIGRDLVKRPYIVIGMIGLLAMLPLAITSNGWSIRKLGPNWRRLHKLAYVAGIAGAAHYMMLVKSWPPEPIIYCAAVAILLILRIRVPRLARSRSRSA